MKTSFSSLFLRLFSIVLLVLISNVSIAKKTIDWSNLKELKNDGWDYLDYDEIQEQLNQQEVINRKNDIYLLSKSKEAILSGNLETAEYYLLKIDNKSTNLEIIKKRYFGLIHFLKDEYKKASKVLSDSRFNDTVLFKDICILRIASQIPYKLTPSLTRDFINCDLLTFDYSDTDHMWLENLRYLKEKQFSLIQGANESDLSNIIRSNDTIRTWLKTGLYLNKEYLLFKNLKNLPPSAYNNSRIRELVGLVHYRTGDIEKAFDFIEDLDSPNAENIKGNIKLKEKKYELAFGHYMLALKRKQNSKNALERAIPLAWIVGNWTDGLKLLQRILVNPSNEKELLTLDTLFRIRMEKYQESDAQIRYLDEKYLNNAPFELELMKAYVMLRNKEPKELHKSSARTCRRFDGLSCWLSLQSTVWVNLGETIDRKEKIPNGHDLDLDSLKNKQSITPINEVRYVDQRDIEELDSALVQVQIGASKK